MTNSAYLGGLGHCHYSLGQIPTAIEHYHQALTITRDTGNRNDEAFYPLRLGDVFADQD